MNPDQLWDFLPKGYLFTIAFELPILLLGLSRVHSLKVRLFSGFWLTACTYPIVVLVLPLLFGMDDPDNEGRRVMYLVVAETFAPLAECLLFWQAFGKRERRGTRSMWCDMIAITEANFLSFYLGEVMHFQGWLS